jgi:secondary thiamine-phosphate synthase enzyme
MIYTDKIYLSTKGFCDIIDITDKVNEIVKKSKIKEGIVTVFIKGSTAAITMMEYEPNLVKDMEELVEKLVPQNKFYHHNQTWGDDNGFSHLRASLFSFSLTIPINNNQLELGTWQQIVLIDFDNKPRKREIVTKVIGEN